MLYVIPSTQIAQELNCHCIRDAQWGSKKRTSLVFAWQKDVCLLSHSKFEWHPVARPAFRWFYINCLITGITRSDLEKYITIPVFLASKMASRHLKVWYSGICCYESGILVSVVKSLVFWHLLRFPLFSFNIFDRSTAS